MVSPVISAAVRRHRPDAVELLAAASAQAQVVLGPERLAIAAVAIGSVTGAHVGASGMSSRDAWAMFTDQFVLDVTGLRGQPQVFPDLSVGDWKELVTALYIEECTARLATMSRGLMGADGEALDCEVASDDLRSMWHAYQNCVMTGQALDPLVTEAVRLRCARTHDCQICQTLRLADARAAGADAVFTDQIDMYERSELPERVKVALRVTDAFITRPDLLDPTIIEQADTTFSEGQLVELLLDITKWSTQKVNVATGTDGIDALSLNEEGVAFLAFAEDGSVLPHRLNAIT